MSIQDKEKIQIYGWLTHDLNVVLKRSSMPKRYFKFENDSVQIALERWMDDVED